MTNNFIRRTYFRETISFDNEPTREEKKLLMDEGFRLDRKNLIWERTSSTSGRHGDEELARVLNVEDEQEEATQSNAA